MSKKQLGAASEHDPTSAGGSGWFARLRRQPGFRTATIAFVLTVTLGIGGTAAYAYWSQSVQATISATTVNLPMVAERPTCNRWSVPTKLEWKRPVDMPPDAYFIVEFIQTNKNKAPLTLAMVENVIEPYNLRAGKEDFNSWMGGSYASPTNISMSVRVGALFPESAPSKDSPVKLDNVGQIRSSSVGSPVTTFVGSRTWLLNIFAYDC